ncbi:hypothetical protein [Anaeromyxobacter terrae]|uniref:hypothetical protein n=1 Tax=Anaeromyxobacter terrae TaxID=2925406 RepID=UPI001F571908|nr:hypothetical protein [Anaeromyxobacter sp. SG22]
MSGPPRSWSERPADYLPPEAPPLEPVPPPALEPSLLPAGACVAREPDPVVDGPEPVLGLAPEPVPSVVAPVLPVAELPVWCFFFVLFLWVVVALLADVSLDPLLPETPDWRLLEPALPVPMPLVSLELPEPVPYALPELLPLLPLSPVVLEPVAPPWALAVPRPSAASAPARNIPFLSFIHPPV